MTRSTVRRILIYQACALRGHPLSQIVFALCPVTYLALGWETCECGKRSRVALPPQEGIVCERKAVER